MSRDEADAEDRLAQRFAEFVEMLQQGIAIDVELVGKDEPELRARLQEALQLARDIANPLARRVPEIPGFQLLRPLGQGSSSTVWLALQLSLSREVALKVVHLDTLPTQSARERCLREARTMARVHDPRVVAVFDVIEHGQWLAIAMDYVDGPNLRALLREIHASSDQPPIATVATMLGCDKKGLPASWSGWVVRQGIRLARALAGLHAHGLVHRDVKPENVLLTHGGETVLADLGLARSVSELTAVGFSGTPFYAAPEQWRSDAQLDGRADVYALGVLLYELLALSLPTDRAQRPPGRPQPLPPLRSRTRSVSRDLATVVHKAIDLDPLRRYADANEFADDLERVLGLLPVLASPPTMLRRVVRFAQRHRRGAIAVGFGVALAVAAFVPFVDALKEQLRAPAIAAGVATEARASLFEVIASRGELDGGNETGDLGAAATLRAAVARYDVSLSHVDDPQVRRERDVAELAASLLEARSGDFPPQLAIGIDGHRGTSSGEEKRLRNFAVRWLSGLKSLPPAQLQIQDRTELISLGLLACLLGDLHGCEEAWNRLDPMASASPLVAVGRAILLAADDRHDRALPWLLRAASDFPEDHKIALRLADAAVRGANTDLANYALQRVPESTQTSSPDARRIAADIQRLQGDTAGARKVYAELARANEGAWLPRARLAALDLEAGKPLEALAELAGLVEQRPDVDFLRLELARAALAAGRLDVYVEQARFAAARAASRQRLSQGSARSLAAILELGGVFDTIAPLQLRKEPRTGLAIAARSVALAVADQHVRERLSAALRRLVAFDHGAWPTSPGRERACLHTISVLMRATITAQDLIVHADPRRGAALVALAHLSNRLGPVTMRDSITSAWLLGSSIAQNRGDRIRPLDRMRLEGEGGAVAILQGDEAARLAVIMRVEEQPRGISYLRAVTPFGVAASSVLRLALVDATGAELAPSASIGTPVSMLNAQCTALDDVDSDGYQDLAVVRATLGDSSGATFAASGRTGSLLWTRPVNASQGTTPWSIALVNDLDGDGIRDLAIGLPSLTRPLSSTSNLEILSGKIGVTIAARNGPPSSYFGLALATCGSNLAIGCPQRQSEPGCVELLTLADGDAKHATKTLRPTDATPGFGRVLSRLPDLNGDGQDELAVSDATPNPGTEKRGAVWVLSPATGMTLWSTWSTSTADGFGWSMEAARDENNDGIRDVWIAAPWGDVGACGQITLHSGANGRVLRVIRGSVPGARIGSRVFTFDDADANSMALGRDAKGRTRLFSLVPETLETPTSRSGDAALRDR